MLQGLQSQFQVNLILKESLVCSPRLESFRRDEAVVQGRREKSRGGMKCCVLEVDIFLLAMLYYVQ
jgi:hypothetical protein